MAVFIVDTERIEASFVYGPSDVRAYLRANAHWLKTLKRASKSNSKHRQGFSFISKTGLVIRVSVMAAFLAAIFMLGKDLAESAPGLHPTDLLMLSGFILWAGIVIGLLAYKYWTFAQAKRIYQRFFGEEQTVVLDKQNLGTCLDLDGVKLETRREWPKSAPDLVLWKEHLLIIHPSGPVILPARAADRSLQEVQATVASWFE